MEIIYSLDEFLWEEELSELSIAKNCFASLQSALGEPGHHELVKWILGALPSCSDRTDTYSMLMALEYIILGGYNPDISINKLSELIDTRFRECDPEFRLVEKLSAQLSTLVSFVGTTQLSLMRDTSRISLLRQASTVSSTSSQHEPSVISAKLRVCLNLLYVGIVVRRSDEDFIRAIENSNLHETILIALRLHSDNMIPVRKIVLMLQKLLSLRARDKDVYLPTNTPGLDSAMMSPLSTLTHFVPLLNLPSLSDFRSFIALSIHHNSLVNWASPDGVRRPPLAIGEAIEICERHMREFVSVYRFHAAEVDLLRTDPCLTYALRFYEKVPNTNKRGNLMKSGMAKSHRFSLPELAKHMISNYQIQYSQGDSSSEESSSSELPNLSLVHEAYQSCAHWMGGDNQEELIEAIAEAAVPGPSKKSCASEKRISVPEFLTTLYTQSVLHETIIVLLKMLLSSCRGAIDPVLSPTNHPSFDLDRDHLLSILERFDMTSPPSTPRDCVLRRNFEILSCAISSILYLLLKLHVDESEFIQRTIVANNGCLVFLKLITSYPTDQMTSGSIFGQLRDSFSWKNAVPAKLPTALYHTLKCLYIVCRNNVPRIKKYLVHYKVAVVLKRFFAVPNIAILKVSYKLFKIQMRFLGRKWKIVHIKLLSCCYNATSLDVLDDWLINDPDVADVPGPSDDLLNDSILSPPRTTSIRPRLRLDYEDYFEGLGKINFEKKEDIDMLCKKYNESIETFFGPKCINNYNDWLRFTLGSAGH